MTRYYKRLPLSSKVLKQLITTDNSCVEVHRNKKHITLFPFHLKNIKASIKEIIDEDIAKYNRDLKGILLGYRNIKLLSDSGILNNDSCFIHMDIEADFILFKPVFGKQLPAIVTKKSKVHVGCLVYNTFNVSLPKPEGIEYWTGDTVEIGQEIIIRVTFADLDAKLPYIRGEFLNNTVDAEDMPQTNTLPVAKRIIFEDDENQAENVQTESKPKEKRKKKKHSETNGNEESLNDLSQDFNSSQFSDNNESSDKKRKKRKKDTLEGENSRNLDETIIEGVEEETKSVKSKRKRKSSSPQLEEYETPKKKKKKLSVT